MTKLLTAHRTMRTKPVLTWAIAGLDIDVYQERLSPDAFEYTAIIRQTGHCEEGHSAVQALGHVFFDFCDMHVESLVLKEPQP